MATNRPDTLDPAVMRPGRLDRKVEFGLPDLKGRAHIFRIHARSMSVERDIRFDVLSQLHGRGDQICVHGGGRVRDPRSTPCCYGERFLGGRQQSHQVLREVLRHAALHRRVRVL
ncbi:unnamed protein product [Parnassius apollo]|uniref:(apollo) hypothetical protein n=1 Tax=Parnassius apollo TaxID=110799 RepID=A0A8S3WXZ6_PARAO|nr:unnamed protein product [Parnassius apollo]